jgi:hypothetical protein
VSPELRKHLTDWLHWAENRAPEGQPFSRAVGLCVNFHSFGRELGRELEHLLMLTAAGDDEYPFGIADYREREWRRTQHLCPKRLAWVREQLA